MEQQDFLTVGLEELADTYINDQERPGGKYNHWPEINMYIDRLANTPTPKEINLSETLRSAKPLAKEYYTNPPVTNPEIMADIVEHFVGLSPEEIGMVRSFVMDSSIIKHVIKNNYIGEYATEVSNHLTHALSDLKTFVELGQQMLNRDQNIRESLTVSKDNNEAQMVRTVLEGNRAPKQEKLLGSLLNDSTTDIATIHQYSLSVTPDCMETLFSYAKNKPEKSNPTIGVVFAAYVASKMYNYVDEQEYRIKANVVDTFQNISYAIRNYFDDDLFEAGFFRTSITGILKPFSEFYDRKQLVKIIEECQDEFMNNLAKIKGDSVWASNLETTVKGPINRYTNLVTLALNVS